MTPVASEIKNIRLTSGNRPGGKHEASASSSSSSSKKLGESQSCVVVRDFVGKLLLGRMEPNEDIIVVVVVIVDGVAIQQKVNEEDRHQNKIQPKKAFLQK